MSNAQAVNSLKNHGSFHITDNKVFHVQSHLSINYSLSFIEGLLSPTNKTLAQQVKSNRVLVVIDENVMKHFRREIIAYFAQNDIEPSIVSVACGEANKNLDNALYILDQIESFGVLRRSEPVIAIGGGVLLDVVGFAASIYRRGVPYIRVPTTLMAMIDACLGVKTGVNFLGRRNRLGTYFAPLLALIDTSFLKTLDIRELASGAGEILKLAVIKDSHLFNHLENIGQELVESKFQINFPIGSDVLFRAIKGMLEELAPNMWELELERLVDFGHSFSPLVEMKSIPELLHGEAVALDVVFSCILSHLRGWLPESQLSRVLKVTEELKLPTYHRLFTCPKTLREALEDTKRHRNGNQNLPIPKGIGQPVFVNDLTDKEINAAIAYMENFKRSQAHATPRGATAHV